ncbi:MAG TPA: SDR family oxidoreductase [Candidatus Acidoferrum sp.]|nr:SDR family oxidoreductase [Candidatus Acidoferrum sp.]
MMKPTTLFKAARKIAATLLLTLPCLAAHAEFRADAATVLITGSNRGIGFELAKQYAEAGWNVIATARRDANSPELADLRALRDAHPNLVIERIDVSDTKTIKAVADKYKNQPLDVLINNAARVETSFQADMAIVSKQYSEIDFDDAALDFSINTLGPMRMVQAFMPQVMASKQKKIVNVTSFIGSFGYGPPSAIGMNYGASKAALNMYSMKLAEQVKKQGVIVALVEPVMVQSKPGVKDIPMSSPADVEIKKLRAVIESLTMDKSGKITNFSTGKTDPY